MDGNWFGNVLCSDLDEHLFDRHHHESTTQQSKNCPSCRRLKKSVAKPEPRTSAACNSSV